jgi:segregation and condensation protein B
MPNNLDDKDIRKHIEALLFVAPENVSAGQIATILDITSDSVRKNMDILMEELAERGIRIQVHKDRFQIVSAPESSQYIEQFLNLEATTRLSRAALETLAIIAYQQPCTRPTVDAIRGVNSDGVMRTLQSKGLIEEAGRSESIGKPILYATTQDFLQHFGLKSLDDMPVLNQDKVVASRDQEPVLVQQNLLKE